MKRIVLAAFVLLFSTAALNAQVKVRDYVPSIGAQIGVRALNVNDSTHTSSTLIGIHSDFYMNSIFRARVHANCVIGGSFAVGVNADAHALINLVDALDIYPLVGVSTSFHPGTSNWFSVGIDAGLGIEYNFNDSFGVFAEAKYQKLWISPMSGFESYIGFTYTF